jgi:putative ABC transport system permease protein
MNPARLFRIAGQRLRSIFRKDAMDAELEREIAFHIEQTVRENIECGMSEAEARRAAHRGFGNVSLFQEESRDQRRTGWLHDLYQDVRYSIRMLQSSPAFAIVAIGSLAIGIGANTTVLGALSSVLLRDLPFPNSDRLVVIQTFSSAIPSLVNSTVPEYLRWKEGNASFESMAISLASQRDLGASDDGAPAEHLSGHRVSASVFRTLGVQPEIGRVFREEEDIPGNPARAIVLSHSLWQRRFGGTLDIVNKEIRIDGKNVTVIGVMPEEFQYPYEGAEFWEPLNLNPNQVQGSSRYFIVMARLKPAVSAAQAESELSAISAQLAKDYPDRYKGWGPRVISLRDFWYGWTRTPLLLLEGAVILVMLIACMNVATLLLSRNSARRTELAMRMVLGAGRGRLVRQLLTESVLIALFGGAAGLVVARLGFEVLPNLTPPPGRLHVTGAQLNVALIGLTTLCSILTGLVFGIIPAIRGTALRQGMRDASVRGASQQFRSILVAGRIGIAMVLLVSAGLLVKSFLRITSAARNFDPQGILSFEFKVPMGDYLKDVGSYRGLPVMEVAPPTATMQRILERLRTLPGVESAAGISFAPVNGLALPQMNFTIDGRRPPQTEAEWSALSATYFVITPDFFATMKTPLVRGRDIETSDIATSPWVAMINEAAARRFWPGEDPIGNRITIDAAAGERPREIIGIVRDVPLRYLATTTFPVIYTPYQQQAERYRGLFANMLGQMIFMVRTGGDPVLLAKPVRQLLAEIEPDRPISNVQVMARSIGEGVRDRGLSAIVVGVFALTAVLLATIGVYGVTAYGVAQRTKEIGIRMALGAGVKEVACLVGGRAMIVTGAGLAAGLAAAGALTRTLESQLWEVAPTDPLTFLIVSLLFAATVIAACIIPTRRALRVDPAETLRR